MDEIKNKIKDSGLIQLDLADFKPRSILLGLDLAAHLWQGLVLKEKDFRFWIKNADWESYRGQSVYIYCSADAIIPTWAFMLVSAALHPYAAYNCVGSKIDLEKQLIAENIRKIDMAKFKNAKVIVKGCSDISNPEFALVTLLNHLQPHVDSLMYGEPCSTVPVYKRAKNKD
jgi:hypothetical protein